MAGKRLPPRTTQCPNPYENPQCMNLFQTCSPRTDVLCPACRKVGRRQSELKRQAKRRKHVYELEQLRGFQPEHIPVLNASEAIPPQNRHSSNTAGTDSSCWHCEWSSVCAVRCAYHMWVACELPDESDILRMRSGVIGVPALATLRSTVFEQLSQYSIGSQENYEQQLQYHNQTYPSTVFSE
jgi:hypothetical protein